MDSPAAISLFSGAGGLDLGVTLALPGIRWLCHVEREAYAAAIIAARMADKTLDETPVWSDVSTFDGKPFNGRVDLVVGGFPCTDLSVAGKRAGINGDASKPGLSQPEQTELSRQVGFNEGRATAELRGTLPVFPPGPGETDAWRRILETRPELAPSLESLVRGAPHELAHPLHERRHRLRATGNGVVAIQAAVAFRILAGRIAHESRFMQVSA